MSALRLVPKGTSLSPSGREGDNNVPLAASAPGVAGVAAVFEVVR